MSESSEESKARHTPGPWRWGQFYNDNGGLVHELVGAEPANEIVLELVGGIDEANARLIAAAPEILNALKKLLNENFSRGGITMWSEGERDAHAAIAKAEGTDD